MPADAGIDPYTREVSDVYQDVFREGSFIGKGIYDVDAFQRAMAGRFPENKILSHDLLEACHARSALVCDVEFYEEFPSRYNVDMDRRYRWIRGDWQITQWLLPRVPGSGARRIANPLSVLSQWKLFDNLRRSLVPLGLLVLLLGSWLLVPELGGLGLLLVVGIVALPGLLAVSVNALRKPKDLPGSLHLHGLASSGARQLGQIFLSLAFLAYDAFISVDAIGKTLVRLLVTHKRLLEWQTSSDSERTTRADLADFYATMWVAPGIALATGLFLVLRHPGQLIFALPLLLVWLAAPWIAWWISQPIASATPDLSPTQLTFLRRTARLTWHFFDTFVCPLENWLPPDNFQEIPAPTIATRTSPTNMGLALLANLAARDLGYLSVGGLIERTQATLATMHRLERHRGHFYNWYETRTLKPLQPCYISSVDSGNLAGHLLTLAVGLRDQVDEKIFTPQMFAGLRDTVKVLQKLLPENELLAELDTALATAPASLRAGLALLQSATTQATQIAAALANEAPAISEWAKILQRDSEAHLAELRFLAPWLTLPSSIHGRQREEAPTSKPESAEQKAESSQSLLMSAATEFEVKFAQLDQELTLREVSKLDQSLGPLMEAGDGDAELARCLHEAGEHARQRMLALDALARQCDELAAMDFAFLFNPERNLFSTGYNVTEHRFDNGFYDLLASEARLCSYVAIALGQVPQDHWFSMGRLLVASHGEPILVSWSGSMFEYLMPLLVMPNYENTLLDHTCRAAVQQQIEYGKLRGVPWGISESGYNRTDVQLNYQYRAFGVPGLGLKRGLAEDLVIAPYATAMALMVSPVEACENLQRLAAEGRAGAYGFHEAVDYTPARLPPDETSATIKSFMAHHQGMSLLALVNLLHDRPMQRRFMACPLLKAADLLLQERVPKTAASVFIEDLKMEESRPPAGEGESVMRVFTNPTTPAPEVHLLSNGRYHVVISSAGGGYSRWRELAVNALARRCHARLLGDVCLSARRRHRRILVHRLSADPENDERLRSHLHAGARGISPSPGGH